MNDSPLAVPHLASLPSDADGPVFREPWEAHAFALAVRLHERGVFTWPEWAAALSAEIRTDREQGGTDDGSRYYALWLAALERLASAKGLVSLNELQVRKDEWDAAARATPHGKPIELRR